MKGGYIHEEENYRNGNHFSSVFDPVVLDEYGSG
jgi:hypothetical protein